MKRLLRVAALLLFLRLIACGEEDFCAVEYSGYLATAEGHLITLQDAVAGKSSPWMRVGEAWNGYRLVSVADTHEEVVVEKDGQKLPLPMREARVAAGPKILRGSATRTGKTITYSPDAIVVFARDFIISAVRGSMVYDPEDQTIRGDLRAETSGGILVAENGTAAIGAAGPVLRAAKMGWSPRTPDKARDSAPGSGRPAAQRD